jgi:hypothetical protein
MPLGQAIDMIYTSDVFLHRWDLARATGQDETLDPDKCAAMLEGMLPRRGVAPERPVRAARPSPR